MIASSYHILLKNHAELKTRQETLKKNISGITGSVFKKLYKYEEFSRLLPDKQALEAAISNQFLGKWQFKLNL